MTSRKARASCSFCEEPAQVQVSHSSKMLAPVTTAAARAVVAENLPLQPQQSSAGPSVARRAQTVARRAQTVADIKSQWNFLRVFTDLGTEENCIVFCEEQGLIPVTKKCSYHKRPMKLTTGMSHGQLGVFRCNKSNCRTKPVPRAQGTWFENVHLSLPTIFQIMYLFSHGDSYEDVQRETSQKTGPVVSTRTIIDWYSYCRETVVIYELQNQIYETKIGGPNKTVVIEESKFGKRKFKKGKSIEGRWVFGMLGDDIDDLRLEVCPSNKRSEEVVIPLIQKHVAEGSIIRTGVWSGYDCLPKYGYIHEKVDNSSQDNPSMAPDGSSTQQAENQWVKLKRQFQKYSRKRDFLEWLAESSWRRKIRVHKKDPFAELLKAVKFVYKLN